MKKCRHGRGLSRRRRLEAWRSCGCAWLADVYVDGRRRYVSLGRVSEREARAGLAQLLADREAGRLRGGGPGVSEVADRWLAAEGAKPGARANSLGVYRSRLKHVRAYFGATPVDRVTAREVRAFLEAHLEAGRAPATVGALHAALNSVLAHAQVEGLVDAVPRLARKPYATPPKRSPGLSIAEAGQVAGALAEPYRSLALCALLTGCRIGELLALAARDVDLERGLLRVSRSRDKYGGEGPPKTRAGARTIPLSPRALELVRGRVELGEPRLWPVSYQRAREALHAALVECELYRPGVSWHSFRDAHAALLDASGAQLRDAGQRLGHGAQTTQTLAYGWAAESGSAAALDAALTRHEDSREG